MSQTPWKSNSDACDFGEPWEARPGTVSPRIDSINPETGEVVEIPPKESDRPWLVWGHTCPHLAGERLLWLSPGELTQADDTWPIITFRPSHARGIPSKIAAERVAKCVNFCAGVNLDEIAFANLKDLLSKLDDPDDIARRQINTFWELEPAQQTQDVMELPNGIECSAGT